MDDRELFSAFTEARLPEPEWNHRAHLRVAWMFLDRHPLDEAHILMRVGIIRLNAFHRLEETPARGYHETMTRVWLALVASLRAASSGAHDTSESFVDARARQLSRDAVLSHYSKARLTSVRARAMFVEPDLAPLP